MNECEGKETVEWEKKNRKTLEAGKEEMCLCERKIMKKLKRKKQNE